MSEKTPAKGYAAHSDSTPLALWNFERRAPRPDDVSIEILYCGVCHSDLHFARDDWGMASYPVVRPARDRGSRHCCG